MRKLLFWISIATLVHAQNVITTVAGSSPAFQGGGGLATSAVLSRPAGVAVDAAGNVYTSDSDNCLVLKTTTNGIISVVAGNGVCNFSGDGGPAVNASLFTPSHLAIDSAGNLFIADSNNNRIRKVSQSGIITTVAGSGKTGNSGDGGSATLASLNFPNGIAVDGAGTLYIADTGNNRVRKVSTSGQISAYAGNGTEAFSGDNGAAVSASLGQPFGVAVDAAGTVYIADTANNRIRKVTAGGTISTFAGNGIEVFAGDGGAATAASLVSPEDVAFAPNGNLFIADYNTARVRQVTPAGVISTVAGNGVPTFAGDGTAGTLASLSFPVSVAVDGNGFLYIADSSNRRVRKVQGGIISTFIGQVLLGDSGPATRAVLSGPLGVVADFAGNFYIADTNNNRIRKVDSAGTITTVAGTGTRGFSGDGGLAVNAQLAGPSYLAFDAAGNLYVADTANNRIRRFAPGGNISTVAGNGQAAYSGDKGQATSASLNAPSSMAFDSVGNLYIADQGNHRIRRVMGTTGVIGTVAGSGSIVYSGDGGILTNAGMDPSGVAFDAADNLFFADQFNNRIRAITPSGVLSTVAGNGKQGYSGDFGISTSASLYLPRNITLDSFGNLYIADDFNSVVRGVSRSTSVIITIAGVNVAAFGGDGGLATSAALWDPRALAFDANGNLLVVDGANDRIRKILANLPSFAVAPASLSFTPPAGSSGYAQNIAISSTVGGLPWTATATTNSGGNWLTLSQTSGTAPGTISVSVATTGLAAGTYTGTITVSSTLASPASRTISVTFVVAAAPASQLAVQPMSINFQAGATNPAAQTLRIGNAGSGTLSWTAAATTASGGSWLVLSQASGTASSAAPTTVQVTANVAGLNSGTYSGSIAVNAGGSGSTKIPVTLLVTKTAAQTQTILLSQTGLPFTGVQGGSMIPPQTFGVLNTAQGVMNWTADATTYAGGNWLSVTPNSGASDAASLTIPQVTVSVNTTGLSAGSYTGTVRIVSTGAVNSPQFVTVKLNVLPPGSNPGVVVRPSGLIFAVQAGTTSPSSQSVTVGTALPAGSDYVSGVITRSGNWLQVAPASATLTTGVSQSIAVQPSLGTLAPAVYQGTLTLQFRDGSAQTVSVLFLVVANSNINGESKGTASAACTPTKLYATDRSLGPSFNSPVSYPQQVEVQLQDDCGNTVTNATVIASFSNGDPPLALVSLRNGLYSATWQPSHALSQLTVTVNAFAPPLAQATVQAFGQAPDNPSAPAMSAGGIVNGASFAPGAPVAPGAIVSVFGKNLATGTNNATTLPLSKSLGGATATVAGIDMPLYFSNTGQINAQLPIELTPNSQVQVIIKTTVNGVTTATLPEMITIAPASPAIFVSGSSGVVLHGDNSLVSTASPARANEQVVVYCTGLGATVPAFATGAPATSNNDTVNPITVTIGGKSAPVVYKGLTVGFVGLYQLNVIVPTGLSGAQEILVTVGSGNTSPAGVTVVVSP